VIRDVAELRERGQVGRCVDQLDVDVATWRAGMRRAARREGMGIRTFLVEPADPPTNLDARGTLPSTFVYAVRTDLPVNPAALAAAVTAMSASALPSLDPSTTPIIELSDVRARRSGHPCVGDADA
jgi:hypothetical protein